MTASHGTPPTPLFVPTIAARRSSPAPALLKLTDAARLLGMSVVTVRRRIREGALAHVRIANRIYVRPQDLAAFVAKYHIPDQCSTMIAFAAV